MAYSAEFLLERFVHHVLQGEARPCNALINEALAWKVPAESLLLEILWPTLECAQRLKADGTIAGRTYNTAIRTLGGMLALLEPHLEQAGLDCATGRSIMVLTAPGECEELGAHITATLAEAHGWTVFFAGAGLTREEISFSIGQLNPDVLLIHGSFTTSVPQTRQLIEQLQKIRIWPRIQIAVTGGISESTTGRNPLDADIRGRDPVETLELLTLCPEYRATPQVRHPPKHAGASGKPLELPCESVVETLTISTELIRKIMSQHFRTLLQHPN